MTQRVSDSSILAILDQVANGVASELDLTSVLENTSRLVRTVVDYSSFVIALLSDEGGTFDIVLQEGYKDQVVRSARISAEKGVIGRAVATKEVIIVDDVSTSPWYYHIPLEGGVTPRSMMAVPLISKDRVIGVIGMESTVLAAFTEEHRLLMRGIASHLAAAVANAKLYEQTVEQIKVMRVIEQIGTDVTSVLDLETLLQEIARLTKQVIEYQAFGIFLIDRERGEFKPHFSIGYDRRSLMHRPLGLDQGLRGEAFRLRRPILANDVLANPKHVSYKLEIDDVVRSQMYVPLQTKKGVIGILVLGNVRRNYYTSRHLRIAHGMATQIAIALENATEFEQVSESEEKLRHAFEIARAMQMAMLPPCCPSLPGYELQAISRPAAQVGGDFYDFFELDKDRLAIVICDVSGFGVSGAIGMASARQVLRIYSEIDPEPASVMNRADYRLKQDLPNHMFVAALYGILDYRRHTFSFCNAGIIEPVLVRDGKARYLESPGTRFPLGKLPDGGYRPRTVHLQPNDLLVFSSDGSIEAYDPQGQPFGFNRYLRTISAAVRADGPAHVDVISRLLSRLSDFVGREAYHDDVTILSLLCKDSGLIGESRNREPRDGV